MYELLKLIVQPVVIERDSGGNVIAEQLIEPVPCYTQDQIDELVANVRGRIVEINEENAAALNGAATREE